MEYNTQRSRMIIPEYGRNVQKMVNHAVQIEDKEERNKVANAIIKVMGQLNPHLRDIEDFNHKLWAHLFIMSDFKLEVDSPYPIPTKETLATKPDRLAYTQSRIRFGHYGKIVDQIIKTGCEMDEGAEKEALIIQCANLMKKFYLTFNRDSVTNDTIADHLFEMSNGKMKLKDPEILTSTSEILKKHGIVSNPTQRRKKHTPKNKHNNRKRRY